MFASDVRTDNAAVEFYFHYKPRAENNFQNTLRQFRYTTSW